MEFIFEVDEEKSQNSDNTNTGSNKLVFTDNPGLFIDMFYEKNDKENNKKKRKRLKFSRLNKSLFKIGLLAFLIISVIFFSWSKIETSPKSRLKQMLKQEQYEKSIKSALLILEKDPDNNEVSEIALESFVGKVLEKGWADKLQKSNFFDARQIIKKEMGAINNNKNLEQVKNNLAWIIDLEEFFYKKSPDIQLEIFRDEIRMAALLDQWNNNKTGIRSLLNRFITKDNLELMRHNVYQHIDMLQSRYFLYYSDIQALKKNIREKLDKSQHDLLISMIDEFHKKHPGIGGIKKIYEDLTIYTRVVEAVKSGQYSEYASLIRKLNFQTGPFAEKIESILASKGLDKNKIMPRKKPVNPFKHDFGIVNLSELIIMTDSPESNRLVLQNSYEKNSEIISETQ